MKTLTFRCQVSNVRPLLQNIEKNINTWLQGCPDLEIVIRKHNSKRSIEQNKRLWKIYTQIADSVWINGHRFSAETWHEYFKGLFIGFDEIINPMTGEVIKRPLSTVKLNTAEMAEYQNKIQAFGAQEFGIEWDF